MNRQQKVIIFGTVGVVVVLALFAIATVVIPLLQGPGVKTAALDASSAQPASTDLDGSWNVVRGDAPNISSIGFTFNEILPSDRRTTSGSTRGVRGEISIADETVTAGEIIVDMTSLATDNQRRDINVRSKILLTDTYPESSFRLTAPVRLAELPADGTVGTVPVSGDLTIKGVTRPVSERFDVVRDGEKLSLGATIHIKRADYEVETPDFIAAKIAEEGDLNILLTFMKE